MSEKTKKAAMSKVGHGKIKSKNDSKANPANDSDRLFLRVGLPAILVLFIWSYWFTIKDLWEVWKVSDEYSSGLLVPFIALYIAWSRREQIAQCPIQPCLWGLVAFILAQMMRYFGLFFYLK